MDWKVQIKLELAFFADYFDTNEFTKLINIQPTNCWNKGDEIPIRKEKGIEWRGTVKPTRKYTAWEYATEYVETYDMDDLAEPLLDKFKPIVDIIAEYIEVKNLEAVLCVVAECIVGESTPALGASKRLIKFLSKIDGCIDEDLYILDPDYCKV
jgi:hypothetical protein